MATPPRTVEWVEDEERKAYIDSRIAELDVTIEYLDDVRKAAQTKNKKTRAALLGEPWQVFIRRMRLLNAQAYGSRIQSYVTHFYGWQSVAQTANLGDVTLEDGTYAEYKATLITASNTDANFVQIRLFQEIQHYRFAVIDSQYKYWRFDLTKEQMCTEVRNCGRSAHVAKGSFEDNQNQEWAIRFAWKDTNETRQRWMDKYLVALSNGVTPDMMDRYTYENASQISERVCAAQPELADTQQQSGSAGD